MDRHPALSKDLLLGKDPMELELPSIFKQPAPFFVLKDMASSPKGTLVSGASGSLAYWFANTKEQGADKASPSQLGTGTPAADTSYYQLNMTYDGTRMSYHDACGIGGHVRTIVTFRLGRAGDGLRRHRLPLQ
jgi:hypothetical protein